MCTLRNVLPSISCEFTMILPEQYIANYHHKPLSCSLDCDSPLLLSPPFLSPPLPSPPSPPLPPLAPLPTGTSSRRWHALVLARTSSLTPRPSPSGNGVCGCSCPRPSSPPSLRSPWSGSSVTTMPPGPCRCVRVSADLVQLD